MSTRRRLRRFALVLWRNLRDGMSPFKGTALLFAAGIGSCLRAGEWLGAILIVPGLLLMLALDDEPPSRDEGDSP